MIKTLKILPLCLYESSHTSLNESLVTTAYKFVGCSHETLIK